MNTLKAKLSGWFSMPGFRVDEEALFWEERSTETLKVLSAALLLGAAGLLAFVIINIVIKNLSPTEFILRILIIMVELELFGWLSFTMHSQFVVRIFMTSILATSFTATAIILILLTKVKPEFYAETWPSLLLIYFVIYGQLVMPIWVTLLFGVLTLIAMPLAGYLIGVEVIGLLPSCLMLLFANILGLYTRYQLELFSRKAFKKRLAYEGSVKDRALFIQQSTHNLRQPLQALSCYCSILDNALDRNNIEEGISTAAKLGSVVDELNNSFNLILNITNLESGQQVPCITDVEINPLLAKLENQYLPQVAKKGLKLKILLRKQPPYTVQSDTIILQQVLGNLIDNAIKYTANGWILIETGSSSPAELEIHVMDTGIGISENQSEIIFNEFHRAHRRQSDPQTYGLGIGLSYVRAAVNGLPGHSLEFNSRQGNGTDFQIKLPAVEAASGNSQLSVANQGKLSGLYVLLVDDEIIVLKALEKQLLDWDCLVEKAATLDQAKELLIESQRPPDLLITDFYLGLNETGLDVIAAVEADCSPVPTIILSAGGISDADKQKMPEKAVLLRKPASGAVLLNAIQKVLGQSK